MGCAVHGIMWRPSGILSCEFYAGQDLLLQSKHQQILHLAVSPKQNEVYLLKHRDVSSSICTFMGHLPWNLQDGVYIILMLMAHVYKNAAM